MSRVRIGIAVATAVVVAVAIAIPVARSHHHPSSGANDVARLSYAPVPHVRQTHQPSRAQRRRVSADVASCRHYARSNSFLEVDGAALVDNKVTITGHVGYLHCGGPDDVSYEHRKPTVQFTLANNVVIRRCIIGGTTRLPIGEFVQYVHAPLTYTKAYPTNFYRFDGPQYDVDKLVELYHP